MSIVNLHKSKHDDEKKRKKDVNQRGHLKDFKLCIHLNGVGISSEITSPASCHCKTQLVCRRLQELTPYVHSMAPADRLYGVQILMSLLHYMHSLIWVKAFSPPFNMRSLENVDKC